MRDLAIRNLYPLAVSINNEADAYDKDGSPIEIDESLITVEIERLEFERIKTAKINSIDSITSNDIEAIVGDNNKQKAKLAEAATLARLEAKGKATAEQVARLDELDSLNVQVMAFKTAGNAREALVSKISLDALDVDGVTLLYPTLDVAIAEVEAI